MVWCVWLCPLVMALSGGRRSPVLRRAAAAEVMEVNAAVAALHEQLTALQANTDPSRANMIKLNLREAEQMLAGCAAGGGAGGAAGRAASAASRPAGCLQVARGGIHTGPPILAKGCHPAGPGMW